MRLKDSGLVARAVTIPSGAALLFGELSLPVNCLGLVLFAHGSGSSRFSPRNQFVAKMLQQAGIGTLLFDLLTPDEEAADLQTRHLRFDIGLLSRRLVDASRWIAAQPEALDLPLGYFGASTGAAAALVAAAELPEQICAVVSRGGRPDLAGTALRKVQAPTLLIVGGRDDVVIPLNRAALAEIECVKEMQVVPGATHLFEEAGALEAVARLAANWFSWYLRQEGHNRR